MNSVCTKTDLASRLPQVRGRYTAGAPLGQTSWFRCGGAAEVLFKPADEADLAAFLAGCPADIPVTVLGVCSNVIIRDGGIVGVTIRMGAGFTDISVDDDGVVNTGAAALDVNVATVAARHARTGLEFFSGIPGSIGGALRMNAGAYGGETKDVLISATGVTRDGQIKTMTPDEMGMSYRHTDVDEGFVFTSAKFRTEAGNVDAINARMNDIREKRAASQPIRARTGGSTFANPTADELEALGLPADLKIWKMIDEVGGRGLMVGGAQMSEQHCNFMLNANDATAADLEALGEEIRKRVQDKFGYLPRWEIRRIGVAAG